MSDAEWSQLLGLLIAVTLFTLTMSLIACLLFLLGRRFCKGGSLSAGGIGIGSGSGGGGNAYQSI